jgi:hypothetical protein
MGVKAMSVSFKLRPEIRKIVDFSIEHNAAGLGLIEDRLVSTCGIDNAQPAASKKHLSIRPITLPIRPSMLDGGKLRLRMLEVTLVTGQDVENPTHLILLSCTRHSSARRPSADSAGHM